MSLNRTYGHSFLLHANSSSRGGRLVEGRQVQATSYGTNFSSAKLTRLSVEFQSAWELCASWYCSGGVRDRKLCVQRLADFLFAIRELQYTCCVNTSFYRFAVSYWLLKNIFI
jgi:hypothetical protein